jgi:hypothetical protein
MAKIGITGHTRLSPRTGPLVYEALRASLSRYATENVHGVTCLAAGADQIFAQAVLDVGGTFEVILPASDYRNKIPEEHRADFDKLLGRASQVHTMPFDRSNRDAYWAASNDMLDRCERLYAVWDGQPSRKIGDSAQVVSAAHHRNLPVEVFWPEGADRR